MFVGIRQLCNFEPHFFIVNIGWDCLLLNSANVSHIYVRLLVRLLFTLQTVDTCEL